MPNLMIPDVSNQGAGSQPPPGAMTSAQHVYDVRPRKDKRGVDLISDALPFGRLSIAGQMRCHNVIDTQSFFSRSHDAVIRVSDQAGNVIETHEHAGDFKEW